MMAEQKHFMESLATVYNPAFWISYRGELYFMPKTEGQEKQIDTLRTARARYGVLTNRLVRYELAAKVLAASSLSTNSQRQLLLPYSDTNENLTPTIDKALETVTGYKIIQSFGDGDVLLRDELGNERFVMEFGRSTNDRLGKEVSLIKEGVKSLKKPTGEYGHVNAFTSVSLSQNEIALFQKASSAFQRRAAELARALAQPDTGEEFRDLQARATDTNPYMQFLLARAYLEGRGTEKDEKLGLEWMKRAAQNGSGDAKSYLEKIASQKSSH